MKTFTNIQKGIISHLKSSARSAQGLLYSIGLVVTLLLVGTGNVCAQGTESFENCSAATESNYGTQTWTGDNGVSSWGATNARIDYKTAGSHGLTFKKSTSCTITMKLTTAQKNAGIGTLSFRYKYPVNTSDAGNTISVTLNGNTHSTDLSNPGNTSTVNNGSITVNETLSSTTVTINISSGGRICIDELNWTAKSAATATLTLKLPKGDGTFVDYETTDKSELANYSTVVKEKLCYGSAAFWGGSWNSGYWTDAFIDYDDATTTQPTRYSSSSTFSTNKTLWPLFVYGSSPTYYHTDPYCPTYHVYYDGNGKTSGTVPSDATDYDGGETVTVKSATLTKTNYTFTGWNTESDGSGTHYAASGSATFTITEDVTLYAEWCRDLTTLTSSEFDLEASSITGTSARIDWLATGATKYSVRIADNSTWASATYKYSADDVISTDVTRTDLSPATKYWVSILAKNDCGTTTEQKTITFTTLAAYVITYYKNDGSATSATESKTEGVNYTISSNKFSRDGYTLSKWNTQDGGGGTDYAKGATYSADAPLTLYAVWTANNYTITLDKNGGSGGLASVSATYGAAAPSVGTLPTKADKNFAGYWTGEGGTGTMVVDASGVWVASISGYTDASKNWIGTEGKTIYAKWVDKTYTNYRTTCEAPKTLDHIAITTNPTKLNYLVGETVDVTGAVVTAYYDDDTNSDVTASVTWTAPSGALSAGLNQNLTASYTLGGVTKTATNAVINVYAVTLLKKDETGATISGELSDAPAVSLTSVNVLSAAATGAQYTFKEWQISGGTLGSAADSRDNTIATVTGAITVTAVYYKPITVTWHVPSGVFSGPSIYNRGWTVLLPDPAPDPEDYGCDGKVFYGWSRTPNYSSDDTAPMDLVESGDELTSDGDFYAVFAIKESDGSAPEWTKTALASASAGTYLICTPGGYAFAGSLSGGDGNKTASAFTTANWALSVFNEDAPVGAQEVTLAVKSSGFSMYVAGEGKGYITAKQSARGGLQYEATAGDYYWAKQTVSSTDYWRFSKDFGSSKYAFLQANSNTDFRNYASNSSGNPIILLKKTAAGVPATYSDFSTSCTCKGFSFHTGSGTDEEVKTTNTRTCFEQVDASTTWKIDNYVIPSDAKFFVGWQDEFKSSGLGTSSRSAVTQFNADEAMYFEYTKNYGAGYRPSVGNAVGAIGTLRIWSDNDWNNCHVGFDPNGYIFKLGSNYYTMSNSATLDGARYKETEVITLTSSDISGQFQVNIAAVAPNASTGVASRYTESKNLTTMGVKSGAGDNWRGTSINNAADANTKGFFRIDKGEGGATNWNAHWIPCYELTFNLKGGSGSIVTTPEYVSVEAASKVVTIPNTVPTKDGYRFMGWSDDDNNTVEYAAGSTHNVTLSGNKTVYAVWKQEFTVTYNYAGGSADPACAGGTFVAGETVTVCTTTPTKTASTFNGWSYSPSVTVTAGQFTMPESNVVVTATWIDTEYTLTHNGSNYTNTEDKTSIKSGDTPFDLHYTCTGTYAFPNSISITGGGKSWTMGTDYTWVVAGDKQSATLHINESIISANVTIEITMQTRCTITYTIPTGGGSCAAEPTTAVLSGETVTLPNVTGISSSYSCETFLGWTTTAPNGSGTWASTPSYKAAGATSDAINSDVTFYAVYSRPGAGASGTVNLTGANIGTWYTSHTELQSSGNIAYGKERSISVGGYTWTTNGYQQGPQTSDYYLNLRDRSNSGGISWIQIPTMPGNINSITFSVTNGGSASTTNVLYFQTGKTSGESVKATSENTDSKSRTLTLTGSYTSGYITANGAIRIRSISVSYGPAPIVSHSLYCGCEVAEFDLTYDANTTNYPGSTITPCTGVTDYKWSEHDDKYTICSTTPTCDGYKFIGWNTQANGSGEDGYLYQPSEEVSCWGEEEVTLYAQYERVYTVTFDNQGVTTPVTQASEGATIAVPAATTACSSEWAFVGWSETAIAPKSLLPTLEIEAGTSTYTPTTDKTLYAIYRKTSTSSAFVAGMSGAYKIKATYNATDYYAQACNNSKLPATTTAGDGTVFYISYTAADGGKYTIQQANGKYVKYAGSSTTLELSDDAFYWTFTANDGLWSVFAIGSTGRYLRYSNEVGFKAYDTNSSANYLAFVAADGQYYYRTMSCEDEFDITFHSNGTTINWAGGYPEASYKDLADATVISTFPTATFDGWTFLGWRSADYTESTTAPASSGIYGGSNGTSGNALTIASANVDLYPVFTKFDDNDPFDQINGGDYYIYFRQTGSDDGYGGENRVYAATYDGEKRYNSAALCSGATEFTFTKLANGKWTIKDKNTNKYLYATNSDEDKLLQSTTPYEWTITVRSGNQFDAICEGQTYGQLIAQGDGTSATFMSYRITNIENNPGVYHPVYLGSCTNRTFTTNPSTTPNIELHGQVKVTSTASKSIKAASVLTVSASNIATANLTLTSDNSAFKFSLTSNGTYTASVNIPVVSNKVGVTPIYVEYTPSATTDGIEEAIVTVSDGASPTPTTATTNTGDVQGRHLPANFVIAAKAGNEWVALTAKISKMSTQDAIPIKVDNTTTPTKASVALNTCEYSLLGLPNTNSRYATNGTAVHLLSSQTSKVLNATKNISAKTYLNTGATATNAASSDSCLFYEWKLVSSDLVHYTVTNSNELSGLASNRILGYSTASGKWGMYASGSGTNQDIFLLPIETVITDMEAEVMEWGTTSMVLRIAGTAPSNVNITLGGTPSGSKALTAIAAGSDLYKVEGLTLTGNNCEVMMIADAADASKGTLVRKPILVSGEATGSTYTSAPGRDVCANCDIVILNGGKLTADENKASGDHVDFANIYVYPGGKLVLDAKSLGVKQQVYVRGGYSWLNTNTYALPELYLNGNINFNGSGKIIYDYYIQNYKYYQFSLPYTVPLAKVTDEAGVDNFPVWVKHYNGALRAANAQATSWEWYEGENFEAGIGYIIAARPRQVDKVQNRPLSIIRFPLTNNAYNGSGEAEKSVSTTAHGITGYGAGTVTANNVGWNFVGNPYMATWKGDIGHQQLEKDPDAEHWNGSYHWADGTTKYITVMSPEDGTDYDQYVASTTELKPFFPFYFQETAEGGNGTLTFTLGNRIKKAPAAVSADAPREAFVQIDMMDGTSQDQTGVYVGDKYSDELDFDDMQKMFGSLTTKPKVWIMHDETRMAFEAMSEERAAGNVPVGYRAPVDGEFTFTLSNYSKLENVESVLLNDNELGIYNYDLLSSDYEFESGTVLYNDTRFTLRVVLKDENTGTPTGTETINLNSEEPLKFIYEDKMYILRGGVIYDATGKKVGEINK